MANADKIGEIIDVNTTSFLAECVKLNEIPALGSFVKTKEGSRELYAVVNYATTSSIDPGRHPVARGNDEEEDEDIFKSNPQLEKLFRSEFNAIVVGYKENNMIFRHLSPKPARIHYSVSNCSNDEIKAFSEDLAFLSMLLNYNTDVSSEELISAVIRQCADAQENKLAFLERAGQELARLLNKDYQKLRLILDMIRPVEAE